MIEHLRSGHGATWLLILVPLITLIDLLPTFIALALRRKDWKRIFALNLVAGLSWPAWIATLAWAVTGVKKDAAAENKKPILPPWFWPSLIVILLAVALIRYTTVNS